MEHEAGPGATSATSRVQLEGALDALRHPVLLVDDDLQVTRANRAAATLLDRPLRDVIGRPLTSLLSADAAQARRAFSAVRAGEPWDLDGSVAVGDGSSRQVQLRGAAVAGASAVAVVSMASDDAGPAPDLGAEVAGALHDDTIVLHYQPIVRLQDRRPVAAEALVRWDHPQRGLLWPTDFLAATDNPELSAALSGRVLRQACHTAGEWARTLPPRHPVQVAVNLSERQLLQPGTVAAVRDALAVADCAPDRLLVEVPEGALLREPDSALRALTAIKALGVDIAVDDLGTGSSALSYLKKFPIDVVKVDRALVAGLGNDPEQSAVVAALVSLSQAIGVRCVAEGVETADQLAVLRRLGCELAQGYLFSRPIGAHAAGEWLRRALSPRRAAPVRTSAAVPSTTVTRALELQAEGASLHTIAARLNAEGLRNTGARRWHHTSVAQLIAGHLYPDLG